MKHEGLPTLILALFVAVVGLAAFVLIPAYKMIPGLAAGLVVLLVLKHVGLLAVVGGPLAAFLKRHRQRQSDRG